MTLHHNIMHAGAGKVGTYMCSSSIDSHQHMLHNQVHHSQLKLETSINISNYKCITKVRCNLPNFDGYRPNWTCQGDIY